MAAAKKAPSPAANALPQIAFTEFRRWREGEIYQAHSHHELFQLDWFPEGEGVYTIEGQEHQVRPGSFFLVPPRHSHTMRSDQDRPLHGLSVKFLYRVSLTDAFRSVIEPPPAVVEEAGALFRAVVSESVLGHETGQTIAALRLAELLVLLLARTADAAPTEATRRPVAKAQEYLRRHLREAIRLADVARAAEISGSHLCRIFLQETGENLFDALRRLRVDAAKDRLERTQDRVAQIAVDCGFRSPTYLHRVFRQHVGMTPRAYRQRSAVARTATPTGSRRDA